MIHKRIITLFLTIIFYCPCPSYATSSIEDKTNAASKYSYVVIKADSPLPIVASGNKLVDYAQVIASFASLGALLFLLWQSIILQRQTKSLESSIKSATYQSLVQTYTDINKTLVVDPKVAKVFASFDDAGVESNKTKELQREWLSWWLLNHYENAFTQYRLGTLTESMWLGIQSDCLIQLQKPYLKQQWNKSQGYFCTEFKDYINQKLLENHC